MISHEECWTFSVAFNGTTVLSKSYIDLRVRFKSNRKKRNYQVLLISIYERHTGQNMSHIISMVLSSLCGDCWKRKLFDVPTDRAANIYRRLSDVVSRIVQQFNSNIFRLWCESHHLVGC